LREGYLSTLLEREKPRTKNAGRTQKNSAISNVTKEFISHPTRAQHTLSAAGTVHVPHALPVVRFSCLLRGRGTSFQDGVAAGEGFLRVPFQCVQIYDYGAEFRERFKKKCIILV
jgi:hypothetical protein